MSASMLSHVLFFCLLLSVQAQNCVFREIILHTSDLLQKTSLSCPCRETDVSPCSCLPIAEPGHELACFVEGTEYMLNNISSNTLITRLNQSFRTQLDRKLCESLAREDHCRYMTKGNVEEFLKKILASYQKISKSTVLKKLIEKPLKNPKPLQ